MTETMSVGEARARVRALKPGKSLVYHRGLLLADREKDKSLDRLASFFLTQGLPNGFRFSRDSPPMAGEDIGFLTQRRLYERECEYRFTKH